MKKRRAADPNPDREENQVRDDRQVDKGWNKDEKRSHRHDGIQRHTKRTRPFSRKLQLTGMQLRELYHALGGTYVISDEEEEQIMDMGHNAGYGELTDGGSSALIRYLSYNPYRPLDSHSTFYDLGSGMGKLVLMLHMSCPLKKAAGIELSPSRSRWAGEALQSYRDSYTPKHDGLVSLTQGDFLDADLSDADYLYMCSTCYPDEVLEELMKKLFAYQRPMMILSHKALENIDPKLQLADTFEVSVTWKKYIPIHVYLL